jgi:hypothetical protein
MLHNRMLFFLSLTCLGDFASPLLVARWECILVPNIYLDLVPNIYLTSLAPKKKKKEVT